jgi:hypothetical protein
MSNIIQAKKNYSLEKIIKNSFIFIINTAARWPNFRPNNSKEAPKKYPWPEKNGGRKNAEFRQKWQKRGRKIFLQLFRGKTL